MAQRGMVQVEGVTYRVRNVLDCYEVVRILDDRRVGAFEVDPGLQLLEHGIAPELVLEVARQALRLCIARRTPRCA